MVGIAINRFGGMVPRMGKQALSEISASFAEDALLLSGELRGIRGNSRLEDLSGQVPEGFDIKRLYRFLEGTATNWVLFDDPTVDMVKAPLVNDQFRRFYYTREGGPPMMNTLENYQAGGEGWLLGIPQPTTAPDVVSDDNTGEEVTRAYVYTFVSAFGEESAPSPPTVHAGLDGPDWIVSNMDKVSDIPPHPSGLTRNIIGKNVYRTITTLDGRVEYHRVNGGFPDDLIPAEDEAYIDQQPTSTVATNLILDSQYYSTPPDELIGLTAHPNGFLIGFDGRDLYFSEPYRPHAWPQLYILSTEDQIQGLGVFATSAAVVTAGHPYVATGIHPASMTFTKAQTANPCISDRRGVVPMPFGVYYPSDTGLMLISSQGFQNATQQLLTKSEWRKDYTPSNLDAVRWQSQYIAFHAPDQGFMFGPDEPHAAFVELGAVWQHDVIQNDILSGDVYMVRDNIVYEWNPPTGVQQTYTWRSKEFVTPKPVNFTAMVFEFGEDREVPEQVVDEYQEYNDVRITYPLNPFNFHALSVVRKVETLPEYIPPPPILPEIKQPFHASPLYETYRFQSGGGDTPTEYTGELNVQIFADGEPLWATPQRIDDEEQYRLPSGYKARRWSFEFTGSRNLVSFKIAETGTELGDF